MNYSAFNNPETQRLHSIDGGRLAKREMVIWYPFKNKLFHLLPYLFSRDS